MYWTLCGLMEFLILDFESHSRKYIVFWSTHFLIDTYLSQQYNSRHIFRSTVSQSTILFESRSAIFIIKIEVQNVWFFHITYYLVYTFNAYFQELNTYGLQDVCVTSMAVIVPISSPKALTVGFGQLTKLGWIPPMAQDSKIGLSLEGKICFYGVFSLFCPKWWEVTKKWRIFMAEIGEFLGGWLDFHKMARVTSSVRRKLQGNFYGKTVLTSNIWLH